MQIEINQISFEDKKYWIKNMFFLFRKTFFWFAAVGMFSYFLGELGMNIITKSMVMILIIIMSFHVCQIAYENAYGKKQAFTIKNFIISNMKLMLLQINYRFLTILIFYIIITWALHISSKPEKEDIKFFTHALEGMLIGYICISMHIRSEVSILVVMINRQFNIIKKKDAFMLCAEAVKRNQGLDWINYILFASCAIIGTLVPIVSFILLQLFIMFNYLVFREIFIGKTKIKEDVKVEIENTNLA